MTTLKPTFDGTIPFSYKGETFKTYCKVFGDLSSAKRTPLVLLHGGPGLSHDYLVPFADLTANASIPVILYDQLGNARSTHLKEKEPTFWTIDLFIDELENLLKHFKIEGAFDLAGHSWGGVLGSEFEVRRKPAGLKHLILSDSLASGKLWGEATRELIMGFPEEVGKGFAAGMKDPPAFLAALKAFHAVHGCTVRPMPAEVTYTLDRVFGLDGDPTVASAPIMQNWTIEDRLSQIRVPAFVINGRHDQATDKVVVPFFKFIPKVKWVTFEQSSHMPFWEERERYMKLVGEFLEL